MSLLGSIFGAAGGSSSSDPVSQPVNTKQGINNSGSGISFGSGSGGGANIAIVAGVVATAALFIALSKKGK